MIIDTHAHIDVADYDEDRDAVIERAREAGVQSVSYTHLTLPTICSV